MKFLFIVGLLLCYTFIFGNGHEHRARVWYPGQNSSPEVIKPPVVLEDADYYEVYDKVSDGALIQKSYRFPVDEPENQLQQSPNNFYFYIVQNFFFGKPINQVTPNEKPADNNNIVGKCRKNKDCKKRGQYCNKGVCTLKPSHPHSHDCKADNDCKLKLPNRFQNLLPVYCEKGHCKIGHRKPFSPVRPTLPAPVTPEIENESTLLPSNKPLPNENKLCNDKLCNGMCLDDVCITAEIVTLAPLPLNYPTCRENKDCKENNHYCHQGICKLQPIPQRSDDCNIDQDCQVLLPKGIRLLIPVYCDQNECKMGIRKENQVFEQQLCKHDSECINDGKCKNNRCVVPEINIPTIAPIPLHYPTCSKHRACKESNHYCHHGVCKLKPLPQQSHDCKVDHDCQLRLPKGFRFLVPVYCDLGHCKLGIRKDQTSEQQLCKHDSECINGGKCQNNRCVVPKPNIPTIATLPLHFPTCSKHRACKNLNHHCHNGVCKPKPHPKPKRHCKVDSDCQLHLTPGLLFLIPVYCDKGECNMGIRKENDTVHRKPDSLELQRCKQNSDCSKGSVCRHRRCKVYKYPTGLILPPIHCKIDHECAFPKPGNPFVKVLAYCHEGRCKHGIRKHNVTATPNRQTCQTDADCSNNATCFRNLCTLFPPSVIILPPKKPSINDEQCKTDGDCIGFGGLFPKITSNFKHECWHGKCITRFVTPQIPQSPTKQNSSKCKTDSDCIQTGIACGGARYCKNGQCHSRQFSTPLPLLIAATKIPCKNDSGCFAHTILCGISHRCENSQCVSTQSPALPPTKQPVTKSTTLDTLEEVYTTPKIWKCKTDHDCEFLPWVPIYFAYRYCDNGLCKQKPFPTIATTHSTPVTEVALPQTPSHPKHPKLCQKDHDCGYYGPLKIMYYPQHCENGVCKKGRRSIIATTELPSVTEIVVPQTIPLHPKHCQQDQDCMYNGILKIQVYPEYCDNGVCKEGRRPIIGKRPTTTQPPVTEIIVPQTKPSHRQHCEKDSDCAHYGRRPFFLTEHCDNGVCKHGIRPIIVTTEQAPTTEVTVHQTTTTHPQHCQKDSDCLNQIEFQHKMLVSVFCHEGYCTLGKSPEVMEVATTLQLPTSDNTAVIKKLHFCESDEECTPFVPHGFTGQCRKHHCIIVPRNEDVTRSIEIPLVLITSVEPEIPLVTVKPLESHSTHKPLHEKTCKKDSDCHHSGNYLHHPHIVHQRCINGKCVAHRRPENTTSDGHTVKPHIEQSPTTINVDVHLDETVKPLESHSTKKPFHRKTCKTDYECRHPGHKVHLRELSCVHGKCVAGHRRHRNTTAHGHTVTAKPHVEQSGSTKNFDVQPGETNVEVHSGETVRPVEPVKVHHTTVTKSHVKHTTPHVYTCRRNRDCIDYPHPKDMPVYCEHRLCKHGHRRPKNDFDACKSDKDCSEGPCVEGFCTKNPNQHH